MKNFKISSKANIVASSPKEVLIAAKYIIDHLGWCQGRMYKYDKNLITHVCAYGALHLVQVRSYLDKSNAIRLLSNFLSKNTKSSGISAFNDTPGMTKDKVSKMFGKVIKSIKNK